MKSIDIILKYMYPNLKYIVVLFRYIKTDYKYGIITIQTAESVLASPIPQRLGVPRGLQLKSTWPSLNKDDDLFLKE